VAKNHRVTSLDLTTKLKESSALLAGFITRLIQPFAMPNRLSPSKRRQSLAEHEVVLAAIAEMARQQNTTAMALMRIAARETVAKWATTPLHANTLHKIVRGLSPKMPARFKTSAQVARFKRAQREYDRALLDMKLETPTAIQN
jgi:transposase